MNKISRVCAGAAVAVFVSSCVTQSVGEEPWVDLLGDGLSAWKDATGWAVAGEVVIDPANEKQLKVAAPGKTVVAVEKKVKGDYLVSKAQYGDLEARIEFMIPKGSNSGIYFMGRYEVQILDSFGKKDITHGDCGGIYQRWGKNKDEGHPPRVNASTAPGTWQSFDVVFRAPRFGEAGKKTENARFVKVVHNGQLVHENVEVTGPTRGGLGEFKPEVATGPIRIQGDHGPVAFKVIKVRPLAL